MTLILRAVRGKQGAGPTWVRAVNDKKAWRCDQLHGKAQAPGEADAVCQLACHVIAGLLQVQQAHHISHNAMPLQGSAHLCHHI